MAHISEQVVWHLFAEMVAFQQILHKNMPKWYHFSTKKKQLETIVTKHYHFVK